jgi:hypothetical protein
MLPGCNEPSSAVAFIGFRHNLVRYELALIGSSRALAHGSPLVIRHRIDAGAPRFDFARVEFVLILASQLSAWANTSRSVFVIMACYMTPSVLDDGRYRGHRNFVPLFPRKKERN